ncbi:MAG TPA: hypothetical protein VF432_22320 [Thermoanaerobaculia bacterium]
MDTFLNGPWFEKLFWLFFAGVIVWIAAIWIRMIVESIRFHTPGPRGTARAKSSGGGFGESVTTGVGTSFEPGGDSGSSDVASSDSSGGSDFSGGGGESGGGGASGSWS